MLYQAAKSLFLFLCSSPQGALQPLIHLPLISVIFYHGWQLLLSNKALKTDCFAICPALNTKVNTVRASKSSPKVKVMSLAIFGWAARDNRWATWVVGSSVEVKEVDYHGGLIPGQMAQNWHDRWRPVRINIRYMLLPLCCQSAPDYDCVLV